MPMFLGIVVSWFFAVVSTLGVACLACLNSKYEDTYERIRLPLEKAFYIATGVVLLYLGIHLASTAFTGRGVPYLGDNYALLHGLRDAGTWEMLKPQDVTLLIFASLVVLFAFGIAPRLPERYWSRYFALPVGFLASLLLAVGGAAWLYFRVSPGKSGQVANVSGPIGDGVWSFVITIAVSSVLALILFLRWVKEDIKSDFLDLLWPLCFIPALIVGPLVLSRHELIIFGNWAGNIVVGVLIISGFLTLAFVTLLFLRHKSKAFLPLLCALFCSLAAISGSSLLFLKLGALFVPSDSLRQLLLAPVAFLLIILPYGLFYERIWRYQFGHWWKTTWRIRVMAMSVLLVMLLAPMRPELFKLVSIFAALGVMCVLPLVIPGLSAGRLLKFRTYQGVVLLKIKPGEIKSVSSQIDKEKDVYEPMVVTGSYDLIVTIGAFDSLDFEKKIHKLRKISGVVGTYSAKQYKLEL